MRFKKKLATILLLCSFCVTACSTPPSDASPSDASENTIFGQELQKDIGQINNQTANSTLPGENTWNVAKFVPLEYNFPEMGIDLEKGFLASRSTACGSMLYTFFNYQGETIEESSFWLCTYDTNTQTLESLPLKPQIENIPQYHIISADVIDEETLTLKLFVPSDTQEAHHVMVEMSMTGDIISVMDPCPLKEAYPWNTDFVDNLKVFPSGNGEYIIRHWDTITETSTLYPFDFETASQASLGRFEQEYINTLCYDGNDTIYYISNGYLKKYNTKERNTKPLCNIMDFGISISSVTDCTLLLDTDGKPILCDTAGSLPGIYYLTDEEIILTEKTQIEFVNISQFSIDYTRQHAASFSTHSNTCTVQLEQVSDNELADFRDRILIDIIAGKGPELLWVSKEDMQMLAQKGAIMDITKLIPPDIYEQLFSGVLQDCTVSDRLVGITPEVSYTTMIVSDKVWAKNTWTFDDMLTLLGSKEWELPFLYGTWGMNNYFLFYEVFSKNWSSSPFVDIQNGISHFKDDAFIKSIQFCKKYDSPNADIGTNDLFKRLESGDSIARICYMYDGLAEFSNYMDCYQDSGHIVGFPTDSGSGNYLYSDGYLVVNANATHTDAISDFIAYLLSYENQFKVNRAPVRRDVVENCIAFDDIDNTYYLKKSSNEPTYALLTLKEDGGTYLEEYLHFAESCTSMPTRPTDITAILGEELPAYFTGNKNAEEVADIIHNRVQLYFDENK